MNHQQVTKILGSAGMVSKVRTRTRRRDGYEVAQIGGAVGVICNVYMVEQVSSVLVEAGLRVYQKSGTASDVVFVGAA